MIYRKLYVLFVRIKKIFTRNNKKYFSYSQEGEDMILSRLFENQEIGFYVDIGAHHPIRFSNTYFFYLKNWKGINIDAMPGCMKIFDKLRPRDINLEIGISKKENILTYFMFNESALNTFSQEFVREIGKYNEFKLIKSISIDTYPLGKILEKYLPINQQIDFFSIDVEGLDLEVLESNDWDRFRPKYILIEERGNNSINQIFNKSEINKKLTLLRYVLFAKTINTLFYRDENIVN